MSTPVLSFVIPVRNGAAHLRACIDSIVAASHGIDYDIIVADNGSTDGSGDIARAAGARVLDLPGLRVADVRNRAAHAADGDLIAFVDSDHELSIDWTRCALGIMAEDEGVWAVGAQYRAPREGTWVQRMYDRMRRHRPGRREVDWLPSGNIIVRREMFERLNGFDVSLETCEDVEFCQRLGAAGGRLVSADCLLSVHMGDPSTLRALFLGELWRGRDNLRVSLRGPVTLRSMPSIVIPFANLLALVAVLAGLITWQFGGWRVLLGGALVIGTLTTIRAVSLLRQGGAPLATVSEAGQAMAVAGVYDMARALALISRGGHELRRRA